MTNTAQGRVAGSRGDRSRGTNISILHFFDTESDDDSTFDIDSSEILRPTPSQDDINTIFEDFNGFRGLINLNSITPNDVNLAALVAFFNNRTRPGLVTAAPTTSLPDGSDSNEFLSSTVQTLTTPSPAPIDIRVLLGGDSDNVSDSTTPGPATASPGPDGASSSEDRGESLTPSSLSIESLVSAITSPSPTQSETLAPVITSSQEPSMAEHNSTNHSEMSTPRTEEPAAERVTPELGALRNSEEGLSQDSTANTQEPVTLMTFLRRAGTNIQVIRTSLLNNVHKIIQDLPEGTKPIVILR